MPMPLWWGKINKRIFNPRAVRGGKWPVIHHVGRVSGRTYRTPLEAFRVDDGFIFVLVYGSRSDWVQNVLAAGTAKLEVAGETVDLIEPALLTAEQAFARTTRRHQTAPEAPQDRRVPQDETGDRRSALITAVRRLTRCRANGRAEVTRDVGPS